MRSISATAGPSVTSLLWILQTLGLRSLSWCSVTMKWLDWGTGLRGTGLENRCWGIVLQAQDQAALCLCSDGWNTDAINPLSFLVGAIREKPGKRWVLCRYTIACHKRKHALSPGVTSYSAGWNTCSEISRVLKLNNFGKSTAAKRRYEDERELQINNKARKRSIKLVDSWKIKVWLGVY